MQSDEWFEYDCPVTGIDFDVEPLPPYGSVIHCSGCGQDHAATEQLGAALRSEKGNVVDITEEWAGRRGGE